VAKCEKALSAPKDLLANLEAVEKLRDNIMSVLVVLTRNKVGEILNVRPKRVIPEWKPTLATTNSVLSGKEKLPLFVKKNFS